MKSLISVFGDIILFFIFTCILIIPCLVLLNLVPSVNSANSDSHVAQDIGVVQAETTSEESSDSSSSTTSVRSAVALNIVTSNTSSTSSSNNSKISSSSISTSSTTSSKSSSGISTASNSSKSTVTSQVKGTSTATNNAATSLKFTDDVKLPDKIILENKSITTTQSKYNLKITDIVANNTQVIQLGKFTNTTNSPIEVKIKIADYLLVFDKSTMNLKTDTLTYLIDKQNDELKLMINPKEETYLTLTLKTTASMRNEKFSVTITY